MLSAESLNNEKKFAKDLAGMFKHFPPRTEGMFDQLQGIEGRPTNVAVLHSHPLMPDAKTFRRIIGVLNALLADVLSLCPLAC